LVPRGVGAEACDCEVEGTKACPACAAYENQRRADRRSARIQRSGLPRNLRNQLLGAGQGHHVDTARRWAAGEMKGLCLTGPVGVGKTWLAGAAAWARLQDHPLQWVSVARMMSQLRAGFGTEDKAAGTKIVTGTGSIVLDDLDKVNPTEFGKEILFAAIDGRVAEGSSILVTTNKALSQIESLYGAPIASRLAGYCEVVRMTGDDRRLS
jgi:DNA replication protein DnaC